MGLTKGGGESKSAHRPFLSFLETLPLLTLNRVYGEGQNALAIYRQLDSVSQHTVQRLMLAMGETSFEEVRGWHSADFRSRQNAALLRLKRLQILQGSTGKVWLNGDFRKALLRGLSSRGEEGNREGLPSLQEQEQLKEWAEGQWEVILDGIVMMADGPCLIIDWIVCIICPCY